MAKVKVGINGFGRIGRQALKNILRKHGDALDVVAINDLLDTKTNAHLFKYDSNYGTAHGTVEARDNSIVIDGERDPDHGRARPGPTSRGRSTAWTSWSSRPASSPTPRRRRPTSRPARRRSSSRRRPATRTSPSCSGVNEEKYDPAKHHVISNASCTTNGLAPVAKVLFDNYGIAKGLLTTVHSYTNSQRLLDVATQRPARCPRGRAEHRAGGRPAPPGPSAWSSPSFRASSAAWRSACRRPTVSVIDFTAVLEKTTNDDEINAAMQEASEGAAEGHHASTPRSRWSRRTCKGNDALLDLQRDGHA